MIDLVVRMAKVVVIWTSAVSISVLKRGCSILFSFPQREERT